MILMYDAKLKTPCQSRKAFYGTFTRCATEVAPPFNLLTPTKEGRIRLDVGSSPLSLGICCVCVSECLLHGYLLAGHDVDAGGEAVERLCAVTYHCACQVVDGSVSRNLGFTSHALHAGESR